MSNVQERLRVLYCDHLAIARGKYVTLKPGQGGGTGDQTQCRDLRLPEGHQGIRDGIEHPVRQRLVGQGRLGPLNESESEEPRCLGRPVDQTQKPHQPCQQFIEGGGWSRLLVP